jgi:hypothetical protein
MGKRCFNNAQVEWAGGINESADAQGVTHFGHTAISRLETLSWRGYSIRVPPLDLQLAVNERRGRHEAALEQGNRIKMIAAIKILFEPQRHGGHKEN